VGPGLAIRYEIIRQDGVRVAAGRTLLVPVAPTEDAIIAMPDAIIARLAQVRP
jgi:acyl-CoA thioesterase FadM